LIAAREMLSDPRHLAHSVAEIGIAVGLCELRTFERAFLRQFGTTPAGWRRDHRG
jgi:transcriptional regulator GlxA family with amidase domain